MYSIHKCTQLLNFLHIRNQDLTKHICHSQYFQKDSHSTMNLYAYAVRMYTFSPLVTPDLPPYTMDQPLLAVPRREQSVHHSCTWPHPGNPWSHSRLPVVKNINCSMPGFKYSSISCASFFFTLTCSVVFFIKVPSNKI